MDEALACYSGDLEPGKWQKTEEWFCLSAYNYEQRKVRKKASTILLLPQRRWQTWKVLRRLESHWEYQSFIILLLSMLLWTSSGFTAVKKTFIKHKTKFVTSVSSHRPLLSFPRRHCSTGSMDSCSRPGNCDGAWRCTRCQVGGFLDKPGSCSSSHSHSPLEHRTATEREIGQSKEKINLWRNYTFLFCSQGNTLFERNQSQSVTCLLVFGFVLRHVWEWLTCPCDVNSICDFSSPVVTS